MEMLGILTDNITENQTYDIGWGAKVLYFRFAKITHVISQQAVRHFRHSQPKIDWTGMAWWIDYKRIRS